MPYPTPGDLPDPAIEPESPEPPALAGGFFTTEPPSWSSAWCLFKEMFSRGTPERYQQTTSVDFVGKTASSAVLRAQVVFQCFPLCQMLQPVQVAMTTPPPTHTHSDQGPPSTLSGAIGRELPVTPV